MAFFKKFINFLIHSNIYLALGSAFLPITAFTFLKLPIKIEPIFIVFTTTIFLYYLNRRSDIAEDAINYPERISFFKKYGNYFLFLTFILYVAGLSLALSHNFKTFFIALIPLLIMIAYSLLRLKKYFLIKNILASIGWASSFILAGAYFNLEFSLSVMIIFLFYFFRAMINTIFCDVRDMSGDKALGIKTLPIKIGIKSTKLFLHFLNILSISLILIALFFKIISGGYIILFVALYGFFCINSINKFNIKTLSELIDGELYMLGGLALLERVLFV